MAGAHHSPRAGVIHVIPSSKKETPLISALPHKMAWRPDNPVELPDGSLVCEKHHLVACGRCTVDYSFIQDDDVVVVEVDDEEGDDYVEDDDEVPDGAELSREKPDFHRRFPEPGLAGIADGVIPKMKLFVPPSSTDTPQALFPAAPAPHDGNARGHRRFRHQARPRDMLIYTDGACLNDGQANPMAGCAFVFRDPGVDILGFKTSGAISLRLEKKGPTGTLHTESSNCAELRAVIAALGFREWYDMGEKGLVIATGSEYVVLGVTEWIHTWVRRGWITRNNKPVQNRDLWEYLFGQLKSLEKNGMDVKFWLIPRAWNTLAVQAAKQAAGGKQRETFTPILGQVTGTDRGPEAFFRSKFGLDREVGAEEPD
jgi:ribonuclease HI